MSKRTPRSLAYNRWYNMIQRCTNPRHPEWKNYGARGITVCDRWMASFDDFYADVGDCPAPNLSIDRPDNNGLYGPGNWRWATAIEQRANQRDPQVAKTHCPYGHPYDEVNTFRNARGHRFCRACGRKTRAAYRIRVRLKARSGGQRIASASNAHIAAGRP